MNKEFLGKTRDGREARIIAFDLPLIGGRSITAIYQANSNEWALNSWYANGRFYPDVNGKPRLDEIDLIFED